MIIFDTTTIKKDQKRLSNQLWKLIPMRENEENWQKQLEKVYIEIAGLNDILYSSDNLKLLELLSKLKGLQNSETPFETYRTVVFESISLLQEI